MIQCFFLQVMYLVFTDRDHSMSPVYGIFCVKQEAVNAILHLMYVIVNNIFSLWRISLVFVKRGERREKNTNIL